MQKVRITLPKIALFLIFSGFMLWSSNSAPAQAPKLTDELNAAHQKGMELRKARKCAEAIPFFTKAVEIASELYGAGHLKTSSYLNSLGLAYHDCAKYAAAEENFRKCLDILEKKLGNNHLDVSMSLMNLASALEKTNRFKEAESLYKRSLAIRESKLPENHPDLGIILNNLAICYTQMALYKEAEPFYLRSLKIGEANKGANHLDICKTLHNMADLYSKMGRPKEGELLALRCVQIQEANLGKDHRDLANSYNTLAVLKRKLGKFQDAEALYLRCIAIHEKHSGNDSRPLVAGLINLGVLLQSEMGRFEEAEALFLRSQKILEKNQDGNELLTASVMSNLASLYYDLGRLKDAEKLNRNCLAIREAKLGPDHPLVANSLNNLGTVLDSSGQFSEAEAVFQRSLRIREAKLGKDHPEVASTSSNLGNLYRKLGRLPETESLYLRSLSIRIKTQGKDHPDVAKSLNQLANLCLDWRRYDQAEPLLRRCLAIIETQFGKDNIRAASPLNNLGYLCEKTNRINEAETYYLRSLKIEEDHLGINHQKTTTVLNNLGELSWGNGQFDKAMGFYKRSLAISESQESSNPLAMINSLSNKAGLSQAMGFNEQALDLQSRSLEIFQSTLQNVFSFSSEAGMYSFLEPKSGRLPSFVTMASQGDPPGPAATAAFKWTLRLKGIVLDSMVRYRQAQHALAANDPMSQRAARYQSLKNLLANAALKPPVGLTQEQVGQQMTRWRKDVEDLERELNRALADKQAANPGQTITAAAVQEYLAPDASLVEFFRCPIRDFKGPGRWLADHYFAFVLIPGQKPPQLFDLGSAKSIDAGVEAVRREFTDFQDKLKECETPAEVLALEKAQEKQFAKVSADLYRKLLLPLQKAIGPAKLLYLAPDGPLNRLPFEALVDEKGKYLVESYRCAYLSSGRDLLRTPAPAAKGTVVFAGPDYKLGAEERLARAEKLLAKKESVALRGMPGNDLRSIGWKALPGAATEAQDIQKALQGTTYGPVKAYVGPEALEEVLKALPAPRVLHLATHGFFLDHEPASPTTEDQDSLDEGAGAGWARGRLKKMDNPLLRSGIVLAGANTIGDKEAMAKVEDGWVTAEEIALLNLRGTELVVLSACQTGLGEVKSGEGVFGLRRAFLYAGARTLVTSLFEVPDKDTRDLMQHFYSGLKAGQGKLTALHAARQELLRRRQQANGAAHPFFWASFILVGDPD
jgi:CHAT domain-containing protein/Tfp pilus assembly protein PilF